MRALRLSIGVLFVALAFVDDNGRDRQRVITGHVVEWRAGQMISIANEQTDPNGVRIVLRGTHYDASAMRTDARVTVWYRLVEERYPVAVRVQVLD